MGKLNNNRKNRRAIVSAFCIAAMAPLAEAQDSAPIDERLLDALKDVIEREITGVAANDQSPVNTQSGGLIDFENVQGPTSGAGIELTSQYANSHGLTFGKGDSVHRCGRVFDDVNASLCTYPQAASGANAAAHDVRSGGNVMQMDFSRPVSTISMKINPTGGIQDEVFSARVIGLDAAGNELARNDVRFNWFQDAFTWPTSATLVTNGARMARVTVELRRAANNQAVRFLIDDLSFQYTPDQTETPVVADLQNADDDEPRADIVETVQGPDDRATERELRIYPAATRIRTKIDWPAAEAAVTAQNNIGISAAPLSAGGDLDRAALPVLLPQTANGAVDLAVESSGDSYSAVFSRNGRMYDYYGTRVLTVVSSDGAAPSTNIKFHELEYGLSASFTLYGVSYRLTQYCQNDNADEDPNCYDKDAFGEQAEDLVVVLGAKAGERP